MSERVWVVPAEMIAEAADGREVWSWPGEAANDAFVHALNQGGQFLPRDTVETDEEYRQVIPYLLVRAASGGYFTYRRLAAGTETRLADLYSIGVGGHINDEHLVTGLRPSSAALMSNLVADGLQRELSEELELPDTDGRPLGELVLHGFLARSETAVERVHVGVVVIVEVDDAVVDQINVRERHKLEHVGWYDAWTLARMLGDTAFEGWSRALIEAGLP